MNLGEKNLFCFRDCSHRRGHLPLNITRQTNLLLPKDSFVFVTKLRASAQNQQALQSGFLYHNLQIIVSVRKSCSGDCRSCLQTEYHYWLMPILRQWGLCGSDLTGFLPIRRQGQETSIKHHVRLFFLLLRKRTATPGEQCCIREAWWLWLPLVGSQAWSQLSW